MTSQPAVPPITIDELLARYDLFLLDAYGVLVNASGALPGAADFVRRLEQQRKEFLVVTNDASRSPETSARRYAGFGLPVSAERVLTSGLLLGDYFAREGLAGARTIVLGTDDSCGYVLHAGGTVVAPDDDTADVVVAADDDGYPFLDTVNEVISVLLRRLARAQRTRLVLPNPDLIFPMDGARGRFGITAGAIAALIEAVVRLRDPGGAQRFVPLGKPHRPMFEAAARRFPAIDRGRTVMVGDQLATDIQGAVSFGIDSVLVLTGVTTLADLGAGDIRPTYTLAGLS